MVGGIQHRLAAITRRVVGERLLGLAARWHDARHRPAGEPSSVFVLRNNDLGDVLIVTPLFDALRRRFPTARLVAGVGHWSVDLLKGNPHLSDVMVVNAPWFNKGVSPQGLRAELAYLRTSAEVAQLRAQRFDVGIDVLGSAPGAALLLRAGIPFRLGVHGFAAGRSASHLSVPFNPHEQVGRTALRFAELLGLPAADLPENRPQIFLDAQERAGGEARWSTRAGGRTRIVIGPGTGEPQKSWPVQHFVEAVTRLSADPQVEMVVVGGPNDRGVGDALAAAGPRITNLAGRCSLRETCGLVAAADAVLTNSSMLMHAAAAFRVPTVVVLGPVYASARQHDDQWGYPDTCRSLGPEPSRPGALATPAEAVACLNDLRGRSRGR
jgi:ADP-heptose:LPS heptosyltransferase